MQVTAAPLTHARIAKFYIPLATSWIFMALESPICVSIVSRLPNPVVNTAGFNILMSIALFIESPIIDLLSTSTTLSKNPRDFALISKFVWYLVIGTALAHAIMVLTPLYWVVTRGILGVPQGVAESARLGLALMIPWSPAIAWRRYRQGLLIRFHRTRMIGFGTAVRVGTVAGVNLLLFFTTHLPSDRIVGTALVCAVVAESLFVHWASRGVVKEHLTENKPKPIVNPDPELGGGPMELADAIAPVGNIEVTPEEHEPSPSDVDDYLTWRRLLKFHSPLVMTTMVTLIGSPLVSAFLSKAPNPVLSLAAWQVAFSVLWLFRTITFALPEVVITLYRDEQTAKKLRDFCIWVGFFTAAISLFVAGSRLDIWIFTHILDAKRETAEAAHIAFFAAAPLAFINAMLSYVRGMLTAHHLNVARFAAVMVGMSTLVLGLWLALLSPWRGLLGSAIAFNFALIAELTVLLICWRRGQRTLAAEPVAAPVA